MTCNRVFFALTVCLLVAISYPEVATSAVYRCRDAQGTLHLGNVPCEQQRSVEEDKKTVGPSSAEVTYDTIREASVSMTSAQFDVYVQGIKDKPLEGQGRVRNIREQWSFLKPKGTGIYEAIIDLEPPRFGKFLSGQEITLELPKPIALRLNKDHLVTFRGRIDSVSCVNGKCHITLRRGQIDVN